MYKRYCELRNSKGYKDADIHRLTGVAKSTLSDWKNGKSTPKQDKLQLIAECLDTSVDYLMTGKEPQFDYLYTDENADFLIEITQRARNKDFVDRIKRYMSLMNESQESVNNMIDLLYKKEKGQD